MYVIAGLHGLYFCLRRYMRGQKVKRTVENTPQIYEVLRTKVIQVKNSKILVNCRSILFNDVFFSNPSSFELIIIPVLFFSGIQRNICYALSVYKIPCILSIKKTRNLA